MHRRVLGSAFNFDSLSLSWGAHLSMSVPLQVLPATDNGQLEGYQENILLQIRDVAGLNRQQDPHHIDVAYHGTVDYHPQPLDVCDFHLLKNRVSF